MLLYLLNINRIFKLRLWLRILLVKQQIKNLRVFDLLFKYFFLAIFFKTDFKSYLLFKEVKKKSVCYFEFFFKFLSWFLKVKKKNLVNFFFFKSIDVIRCFFYKIKHNYKLYQISLVFLRKVFKSLFFVRTLFLDKFLLQKILILNFNFVILNGFKYVFDLFFYDKRLLKHTFFILEFKNLNHIYKFKSLSILI